jgi:hypothetical protein
MATAEESTPVDSSMIRLAGDGNENVCLDTVATTIASAEEIRLVCFLATTETAGKDGTGDGVDTVATQNAAGETGTLHCSARTDNSTVVSNPINLIPIGLDTVVISTAAGETDIGGYAGAAESFPATDNTREHEHSEENSEELPAVAGHDIHPPSLDTATISTATGETSIGGYKHVVGSFSATDKDSAPSSVANADDNMERTETAMNEDRTNQQVSTTDGAKKLGTTPLLHLLAKSSLEELVEHQKWMLSETNRLASAIEILALADLQQRDIIVCHPTLIQFIPSIYCDTDMGKPAKVHIMLDQQHFVVLDGELPYGRRPLGERRSETYVMGVSERCSPLECADLRPLPSPSISECEKILLTHGIIERIWSFLECLQLSLVWHCSFQLKSKTKTSILRTGPRTTYRQEVHHSSTAP